MRKFILLIKAQNNWLIHKITSY